MKNGPSGGVLLTLEDSAKVCREIFLRGIDIPVATPVQKFLQRHGEAPPAPSTLRNGSNGNNGSNGSNGTAKAKAALPAQKRSWLRICQQVWKVPGSQTGSIAQMTEAGVIVSQIMGALSKESIQQQLDAFFNLLQGDHLASENREANIIECIIGVSRLVCGVAQPILKKQNGEVPATFKVCLSPKSERKIGVPSDFHSGESSIV